MRQFVPQAERSSGLLARLRRAAPLLLVLALPGCGGANAVKDFFIGGPPNQGEPGHITGFIGGVAAEEPRAALTAREVLARGGNAADAATALAFTLAVTLPSRAGLGSGGACLAYSPASDSVNKGVPEAVMFTLPMPPAVAAGADRPAAVPMLARGLFALQARYGKLPIETLIAPAEQLARFGTTVSRALANDLSVVGPALLADPPARAVFGPNGTPLTEGQQIVQPDLGATLAQLRIAGVGDLYQGALARRLVAGSAAAGASLTAEMLRAGLPSIQPALVLTANHDRVAFLPPPADGGLAAEAAFIALSANPADFDGAARRAASVAAAWRAGQGDAATLLKSGGAGGTLPPLPASTAFATLDRDGNAVACALTMDNLFGTGRIVAGTGLLLAASPATNPPPLLAAALAWNPNIHGFRAAIAGSGQNAAALAVADGMLNALRSQAAMPAPVPDPGRIEAITCSRYLPDETDTCRWATDPRGAGLALGGD